MKFNLYLSFIALLSVSHYCYPSDLNRLYSQEELDQFNRETETKAVRAANRERAELEALVMDEVVLRSQLSVSKKEDRRSLPLN